MPTREPSRLARHIIIGLRHCSVSSPARKKQAPTWGKNRLVLISTSHFPPCAIGPSCAGGRSVAAQCTAMHPEYYSRSHQTTPNHSPRTHTAPTTPSPSCMSHRLLSHVPPHTHPPHTTTHTATLPCCCPLQRYQARQAGGNAPKTADRKCRTSGRPLPVHVQWPSGTARTQATPSRLPPVPAPVASQTLPPVPRIRVTPSWPPGPCTPGLQYAHPSELPHAQFTPPRPPFVWRPTA